MAYRSASVVAAAHRLPTEKGRLLLLHGVMDENVHLKHTFKLIARMEEIGRPYDLQLYPGERHGIRLVAEKRRLQSESFQWVRCG